MASHRRPPSVIGAIGVATAGVVFACVLEAAGQKQNKPSPPTLSTKPASAAPTFGEDAMKREARGPAPASPSPAQKPAQQGLVTFQISPIDFTWFSVAI
jgi:hypothetical protein